MMFVSGEDLYTPERSSFSITKALLLITPTPHPRDSYALRKQENHYR